ncbi:beta-ketoacyl-[acyl-carrier-protein] synthase family protein [Campylobacterota bacterium]
MNNKTKKRVFVNAVSAYTCVGDTEALVEAMYTGKTGIEYSDVIPDKRVSLGSFETLSFFEALEFVCDDILKSISCNDFSKVLLLVGSSVGGMPRSEEHFFRDKSYENIKPQEHVIQSIGSYLKDKYNFTDARSYSTACTSSSNALMMAKRLLEVGAYKSILVIGADALCKTTIFGFNSLSILSNEPCKPFDKDRDGMNVSEGVGALFLESCSTENSIEFLGAAGSSDAYHITNPDPSSIAAISAMERALIDASLKAEKIDYINAHGTGTQANDAAEANAMNQLFEHKPFVSSTKGITGHTLGAAGAIEAVVSVEALRRQKLPINVNCKNKESDINIVITAKEIDIKYVMSNSFAFGGNNTSLIFGKLA